jgi:hypothetical protein
MYLTYQKRPAARTTTEMMPNTIPTMPPVGKMGLWDVCLRSLSDTVGEDTKDVILAVAIVVCSGLVKAVVTTPSATLLIEVFASAGRD